MKPKEWPAGDGEMAHLVREHDWAATPLGPIEAWPQSLRTVVDLCLGSAFPSYVWWGPEFVQVYNDAALPIVRAKHPAALGAPARRAWADVWQDVGALIEGVAATGEAVRGDDVPMVPERGGRPEMAWFTFSYSPLRDEAGTVAGVFCSAIETTARIRSEEALREIEERFRALIEGWAQAVWETDAEGVVVADSPSWRAYTGQTLEEWLGYGWVNAIHPDDRLYAERQWRQAVAACRQIDAEFRLRRAKGGWRWTNVRAAPLLSVDGTVLKWVGMNIDITKRKRAEEALKESEKRFRRSLQIETVGVLYFDLDGRITGGNDALARMSGYSLEQLSSGELRWDMLTPPEWIPVTLRSVEELRSTGSSSPFEKEYVRPDGSRWWGLFAGKMLDSSSGIEFVIDITERREAEEALKESEERHRLAVEAADLGRWELVPKTGEFYTSATCNRHIGLLVDARPTHEEHFENINPDDHAMIYERLRRAVEDGEEFEAEYRVSRPDGSPRFVLSRGRVVHGHGSSPDRLIGVTLDVTEARELEKERANSRARELTMLAEAAERQRISRELHDRVAHSMGVAHQSLELYAALSESAPDRAQEKLELARETTKRALDQTRALSAELKRLQEEELAGGMEAAFEALLAESYVPEGVKVDLSFSGEESAIPKPVKMQVYLAMREAVRNAVRHSGCSRLGITLEVHDGEVCGLVEDDGEGFDPEAVGKATPSWGVGLRSMRERAEMLGGDLRVASSPGAGARVELRVPLDGRLQSSE